jgi:hypothetical protein
MKTEKSTETKTARRLPGGKAVWQKDPRAAGDKLAYSVKEAADALGVSAWYIRDEMNRGHLACSCPRGRQLIPRWELVRYLEASMSPAAQAEEQPSAAAQAKNLLLAAKQRTVMA